MQLTCESAITQVTVHARGALVTRRTVVPAALPDGDVELVVPGITVLAEGGSVRAALPPGDRAVVAVRTALAVPASADGGAAGASVERVRALAHRIERLQAEHARLSARRAQLAALPLDPRFQTRAASVPVTERTADALATGAMLGGVLADLDARLVGLDESLRVLARERDAAALADAQTASAARMGAGHPTRQITVHLAGRGVPAWLDVTYAVPAARWWPVYTLRITEGGRRAAWWIEALVAQLTGEDWDGVRLALSTADLVYDARLPELPSLRLGRAQVTPRKGYRPPPPGLDRMFAGYDSSFSPETVRPHAATGLARDRAIDLEREEANEDEGVASAGESGLASFAAPTGAPASPYPPQANRAPGPMAPMAPMAQGFMDEGSRMEAPARRKGGFLGGVGGRARMSALPHGASGASGGPGGGGGMTFGHATPAEAPPEPEAEIEPADAWLDFDALVLAAPDDRGRRGRLVRDPDAASAGSRARAAGRIDALPPPAGACDPLASRGRFDHRYDADGVAEVPSDAQAHRIMLGTAETVPTLRWRAVPREAPEVYREAELRNPFDAPLLAGPVDVYVEGSLLAVTAIERIDRGGTMHVGMGVEERLRVARNARAAEETTGILGGSTVVTHTVAIELSSALGTAALVDLVDRVPVSDDKTVEVVLVSSRPEADRYSQAERGAAVRGALLWKVIVPAGGKLPVEFQYRVTVPSRSEIVGGNRRD